MNIFILTIMALISQTVIFWGDWEKMTARGKVFLWATTMLLGSILGISMSRIF